MSPIIVSVPDELAEQLKPVENQLPRILALGLRELYAQEQPHFAGSAQVLEFFAGLPTPDEILALQPSTELQTRVSELLEKNRTEGLSTSEAQEWEQYEYLEHLVRLAKAKAYAKLYAA